MRILVTGGPVHAHLDPVKIITNRFRGGLMAELAEELSYHAEVTYLTAKGAELPTGSVDLRIITHRGIHDYLDLVTKMAKDFDAVVLGAAVANLIPAVEMTTKFPSHNYKPGDVIPINFTIAPRIVDEVKKAAPWTKLFAFKLLTNVQEEELISAAYGIVLEAKATAVFANDTNDLSRKLIVTRERGVLDRKAGDLKKFILECAADKYYTTTVDQEAPRSTANPIWALMFKRFESEVRSHEKMFETTPEGYVFGTIAVRGINGSFLTTGRGKNELDDRVYVKVVDHTFREVITEGRKATLNAPLLDMIFKKTTCQSIIHWHRQVPGAPTLPYAPAGTVRDAERVIPQEDIFNIEGHGAFLIKY